MNFFQPTMQLQEKRRHGARGHKAYDTARTPYRRLLDHGVLSEEQQEKLTEVYFRLNPAKFLRQIKKEQERLWELAETPL